MSDRVLNIGVVGLKFGKLLLPAIRRTAGVRLIALADRQGVNEADVQGVNCYSDGLEMIAREPLDALVIATSPRGRAPLLQAAAQRGLWCFVEKPWASGPEQARTLRNLCAPIADRVMLGFSFRFLPAIVELRRLLGGDLGRPVMLGGEYAFDCQHPAGHWIWQPESGGGFFNENTCHLFDAVCSLLGRPTSLHAFTSNPRSKPLPELACINLAFESGAIASLTAGAMGTSAFLDSPQIHLFTEHGQARLHGRHHIWETLRWALRGKPGVRESIHPSELLGATRYNAAFAHFADCIRHNRRPEATIDDGVVACDLAGAVDESARTGQRVQLPPVNSN